MRKKLIALFITITMLLGTCLMFTGCDELLDVLLEEVEAEETADASEETTVTVEDTVAPAETSEGTSGETSKETSKETESTEATTKATETEAVPVETLNDENAIDIDGTYTSKDDVALYIYTYGELPHNFMTKNEARELGWEGGSLEDYAPGMCIGGDYFGNYEGLLPTKSGRDYHECDIDTLGAKSRGPKRIIYSNDGLIYYTSDHYESFTLLYGEE